MKKLLKTVKISQELSALATEEAVRTAEQRVSLQHVLVALVRWDSPASQELRAAGLSEDRVRSAVTAAREEDLRHLGFSGDAAPTRAGSSTRAKADWDPVALEAISRAARKRDGYAALEVLASSDDAPLRELTDRLNVDLKQLTARPHDGMQGPVDAGDLSSTTSIFVTARTPDAMNAVTDPATRRTWDSEFGEATKRADGSWSVESADRKSTGTLTVSITEPGSVVWATDWDHGVHEREQFMLIAEPNGTTIRITSSWTPAKGSEAGRKARNPAKRAADLVIAEQRNRRTGASLRAALSNATT
ncbi:Clp protease N-terminal domain-containing protein [Microbacterium sp. NPDC087589]|uniref:Clp protease N-terminal domain-containing protein n=1 Tax=Microbacterium sp. NPDC087589 TaxID=3364191 RepID=UPI00381D5351